MTPLVKICGITRWEDAEAAVALGASAIGFIFWPGSPRLVAVGRAREIVSRLPPFVTPVGVFVDQSAEEVNRIAGLVGLGAVQLHGDESPEFAAAIDRPVVKAVSLAVEDAASDWPARIMLLVDAHDPVRRGGTGKVADWLRAEGLARKRRIILAGGLTPDNVADAVNQVRPYGIDVSSGVEAAPGIKDRDRLAALFSELKNVESGARIRS